MARTKKLGSGYRKRKDGRYEYRWTQNGKRYSVTGWTVEEVKTREFQRRKEIEENSYQSNKNVTLTRYFEEWQRMREGHVKETTLIGERYMFKHIQKHLGNIKVRDIEKRLIVDLRGRLVEELSTNYTNGIIKCLSSVLKTAVSDGIIERNPCDGIGALKRTEPPARETIHRALTIEETKKFLESAKMRNSWYYELYRFLLCTGVRIGEAGALRKDDIDYRAGVIHVRRTLSNTEGGRMVIDSTKTVSSKRDIPITTEIKEILHEQERRNREVFGSNIVMMGETFFRTLRGDKVTASTIRNDIKATLKNVDMEYFAVHAFRDTFATRAIESGMNPRTLQEILGHASFSMTMDLYAHVMENTKAKEMSNVYTGTE